MYVSIGACTTEPYKDSIGTFAKGISASQSALVKLDQRNNEIKREQQLRAQTNLKLGPCNVGSGGCEFTGLTPPKSTIPTALSYMAQLVAYSNGLADLVAAKDTAAIEQASGKINAAAQSSIKSFGTQVGQSATILAALDLVNTIANDIIDAQRVAALRAAVLNNRSRIESAINSLANTSYQLQVEVVGIEKVYLNQQAADFNSSTDPGVRQRLSEEISSEQESCGAGQNGRQGAISRTLEGAQGCRPRAARPELFIHRCGEHPAGFSSKAQALDAAVKKGS